MNRPSRAIAPILVGLLCLPISAIALDYASVDYVLEISESIGRFSLYARNGDEKTALFLADDPTTSYLSVLLNGRVYRLGDSFEFRQTAGVDESGGWIEWSSSRLLVRAEIDIATTAYATLDVALTNVSEISLETGLRLVLDTYLGEGAEHFRTPDGPVDRETDLSPVPDYLLSGRSDGVELYLLFRAAGATTPDRIVLANWKRINDAGWNYTVNTKRNFSLIPYSINDSAVSLYYNPETLGRGATRTVRFVFSSSLPAAAAERPGESPTSAASTPAGSPRLGDTGASQTRATIEDDLATVDLLLRSIDRILDAGREPTEQEIQELKEAIRALRERRSKLDQ